MLSSILTLIMLVSKSLKYSLLHFLIREVFKTSSTIISYRSIYHAYLKIMPCYVVMPNLLSKHIIQIQKHIIQIQQ